MGQLNFNLFIIVLLIANALSLKVISLIFSIIAVFLLFCNVSLTANAQSEIQTTKYRNIVIDLGNGLETNARLNLPVIGDGPFPGILLVPGSGITDMNETAGNHIRIDNETGSLIYPSARPFFDVAQYLSERETNDSDTPIQQAFLLQQKLTEIRHPNHLLNTYTNLGHLFYPSSQWITAAGGPIESKVLEDLYEWISDRARGIK
jgi:hypothetical protein